MDLLGYLELHELVLLFRIEQFDISSVVNEEELVEIIVVTLERLDADHPDLERTNVPSS